MQYRKTFKAMVIKLLKRCGKFSPCCHWAAGQEVAHIRGHRTHSEAAATRCLAAVVVVRFAHQSSHDAEGSGCIVGAHFAGSKGHHREVVGRWVGLAEEDPGEEPSTRFL